MDTLTTRRATEVPPRAKFLHKLAHLLEWPFEVGPGPIRIGLLETSGLPEGRFGMVEFRTVFSPAEAHLYDMLYSPSGRTAVRAFHQANPALVTVVGGDGSIPESAAIKIYEVEPGKFSCRVNLAILGQSGSRYLGS